MEEERLKAFVFAIAKKAHRESRLLYPNPQHYIFADDVLDAVHDVFGVSKDKLGDWVDEAPQD